jgi:hypothetical protein
LAGADSPAGRGRLKLASIRGDMISSWQGSARVAPLRHVVAGVALALTFMLLWAAPARGQLVEVVDNAGARQLRVTAATGAVDNNIQVFLDSDPNVGYQVIDTQPLAEGNGCVFADPADPTVVNCLNSPEIFSIVIDAGDGTNTVAVNVTRRTRIVGGSGIDTLSGGSDDDTFLPGLGDDPIDGGLGFDTVDYANAPAGVIVNLGSSSAEGGAGTDTLTAIEGVRGSELGDILTGSGVLNEIFGGGGPDTIDVRDGDEDRISCGNGPDPNEPDALVPADNNDVFFDDSCEEIDAIPETAVAGPPLLSASSQADFTFSAISPSKPTTATFACAIDFGDTLDAGELVACSSFASFQVGNGAHKLAVVATNAHGTSDPTPAIYEWSVDVPPPATSAATKPLVLTRPPTSLVLISGRTIKVSRRGRASLTLNCSGTRDCVGNLKLATARRVRVSRKRRRIVTLVSMKFSIPAGRTQKLRIKLTRPKLRLVRRLRRIPTDIIVRDKDRSGRSRTSTRTVTLRSAR